MPIQVRKKTVLRSHEERLIHVYELNTHREIWTEPVDLAHCFSSQSNLRPRSHSEMCHSPLSPYGCGFKVFSSQSAPKPMSEKTQPSLLMFFNVFEVFRIWIFVTEVIYLIILFFFNRTQNGINMSFKYSCGS